MRQASTKPGAGGGATTAPESLATGAQDGRIAVALLWVWPRRSLVPLAQSHVLGRDPSCSVPLRGPNLSRRHAEVRMQGAVPVIRDLGSRNGTWVNGRRIEEHVLGPRDVVRVGEWIGLLAQPRRGVAVDAWAELAPDWFGGPTLQEVLAQAQRLAQSDLPMVIEGETGTGKEGVARLIHAWSGRKGPLVSVNCAAIPAALAEGELFGYRKGAFTGAERAHEGFLRAAHGGTLFLDEVLELPPLVQPKLLRALETGEVQALGEVRAAPVDVRFVVATQEPLARALADKRLRPDLVARLDGGTVKIPPLRDRREDIVPLFMHLLSKHAKAPPGEIDPRLIEALLLYDFPLNVRELVLQARRLVAMHEPGAALHRAALPERMRMDASSPTPSAPTAPSPSGPSAPNDPVSLDQLVTALRAERGNLTRAAIRLGISRARAYRLLEAHPDVDVDALRRPTGG
jgi:transcriptional regulator with AAA-type ATPase domain